MTKLVLRMILRVYPADFRRRFEAEMVERADAMLDQAGSATGRLVCSVRILGDALWSVPKAWGPASDVPRVSGDPLAVRVLSDLLAAGRLVRRRPGLALTVVATLGFSIGVTTSLFSVVNGVLLRPLPYENPQDLVRVYQTNEEWNDHPSPMLRGFASRFPLSYPILMGWHRDQRGLEDIAGFSGGAWVYIADGRAVMIHGQYVSPNLFSVLGAEPEIGRLPGPEYHEVGAGPVVVLSHGFWSQRLGQDPEVLDRTITLDDAPYPIVAVMPQGFGFDGGSGEGEDGLWMTFDDSRKMRPEDSQWLSSIARLKDDVSLEAARADLEAVQQRVQEGFAEPVPEAGRGVKIYPLLEEVVGDVRQTLLVLLGAVGLVLLIACGNIANLLLVSGLGRRRELAVRAALGASPGRLIQTRFAEVAVLTVAGGVLGAAIAVLLHQPITTLLPTDIPRIESISLDGRVFGFALLVTFGTTLLVSLLPAVLAGRTDPAGEMKEGGIRGGLSRRMSGLRSGVVVTEVALSVVLLVSAALLGSSYWRMQGVELGFDPDRLATLSVRLPETEMVMSGDEPTRVEDSPTAVFTSDLDRRLREIPGVTGVALTDDLPLGGSLSSGTSFVDRPDGTADEYSLEMSLASVDFFDVMGIALTAGRAFGPADAPGTHTTIINETAAQLLWPGQNPIGQRIRRGSIEPDRPPPTYYEVIGVARDVRHVNLTREGQPRMYRAAAAFPPSFQDWVLRIAGDPGPAIDAARAAVWATDPGLPVQNTRLMPELVRATTAQPRFRALLIGTLALLAGLLAVLGIAGVVGFSVSQRTREIGVRVALGAHRGEVVRAFIKRGLGLALVGSALGLAIAYPTSRVLTDFLFGVGARDPLTFTAVAMSVVGVSCLAAWWPARKAARVDPVRVLKAD